jgi:hypothetical protein
LTGEQALKQLKTAWMAVTARISAGDKQEKTGIRKDFFELVEEARRDWQSAMDYFNHVVDPDLVDHAIHAMEAAERKYTYLLKKARQEGYRLPVRIDTLREGR